MDRLEELKEGFRYSLEPPLWVRGPAKIVDDDVVLEQRQRDTYQPHAQPQGMLFDLAAISEPHDVLRFVRSYGLLWCGPNAEVHREPLDDWRLVVAFARETLALYEDTLAIADG